MDLLPSPRSGNPDLGDYIIDKLPGGWQGEQSTRRSGDDRGQEGSTAHCQTNRPGQCRSGAQRQCHGTRMQLRLGCSHAPVPSSCLITRTAQESAGENRALDHGLNP
jgi:hypothetical protein